MNHVVIHSRVNERHPELSDDDVRYAWENYLRMAWRTGDCNQVVAIGFDKHGRAVEMVAKESSGDYLIYHAMTPPTRSLLIELGMLGWLQ